MRKNTRIRDYRRYR